ncbi:MAG: putative DNA binding domain-containing protein [Bacilli bacterium]|nr:putative DNA binding domain-containing protein [Bacilli bacterium]
MKFFENNCCELKSILTKDIKKEIIAFANTNGGKIYIGIDDNGNIIGIDNIDDNLQSLTGMINEGIKPSLIEHAQIKIEKYNNKDVIIVDIQSGPNKPYYLADKGLKPSGVYLRHGSSSIQVSDEIIRKMIFEHASLRFEEMISKNQDLSFEYLEKKFKDSNLIFDKNKYKLLTIVNDENKYTNLGLLLSDQCSYTIKCAIFNGTNKIEFRDRKEFTGSILKQVDDIFEYFELFNKISGKIIGLKRVDTRDYPEYSLREALLNAVIHRSYYFDSSIMVTLYDDKFEIVSMGGLIDGITIKEIFKGISSSRNPNLVNIFYRLGYVESFGTGVGRIMDSYDQYDKKPIFDATENTFSITLPNMNYQDNNTNTNIVAPNVSQEDIIINYIEKYTKISRIEAEKLLNVSKTRAYEVLNNMLEKNVIKKENTGKNTYYVLK